MCDKKNSDENNRVRRYREDSRNTNAGHCANDKVYAIRCSKNPEPANDFLYTLRLKL